jgi:hypothetical protein
MPNIGEVSSQEIVPIGPSTSSTMPITTPHHRSRSVPPSLDTDEVHQTSLSILASPEKPPKGQGPRGAPRGPRDKNVRRRLKRASEAERAAIKAEAAARSEWRKSRVWAVQRAEEERCRQEEERTKAQKLAVEAAQQDAERVASFRQVVAYMHVNGFPTMWSFFQTFFLIKDNQISGNATRMVRNHLPEIANHLAERDPEGTRQYSVQVVSNLLRLEASTLSQALRQDILSSVRRTLESFSMDSVKEIVEKSAPTLLALLNNTMVTHSKEELMAQGRTLRRDHNIVSEV